MGAYHEKSSTRGENSRTHGRGSTPTTKITAKHPQPGPGSTNCWSFIFHSPCHMGHTPTCICSSLLFYFFIFYFISFPSLFFFSCFNRIRVTNSSMGQPIDAHGSSSNISAIQIDDYFGACYNIFSVQILAIRGRQMVRNEAQTNIQCKSEEFSRDLDFQCQRIQKSLQCPRVGKLLLFSWSVNRDGSRAAWGGFGVTVVRTRSAWHPNSSRLTVSQFHTHCRAGWLVLSWVSQAKSIYFSPVKKKKKKETMC